MDLNTNYIATVVTRETVELKNSISEIKATLSAISQQNELLVGLVSEQQSMFLATLHPQTKSNYKTYETRFPIETQDDLDNFEAEINETNREDIIAHLQTLVAYGGLHKNIGEVLSLDIILHFNLEGTQRMRRLLDYGNIIDVLFHATNQDGRSHKTFLNDLRRGFKLAKNRHFKNVCLQKKKNRNPNEL